MRSRSLLKILVTCPGKIFVVDIVFGHRHVFLTPKAGGKIGADAHIVRGGAKKVIISAPAKGEDLTIVLGVNEEKYDSAIHHIISDASCTTNCLACSRIVWRSLWHRQRSYDYHPLLHQRPGHPGSGSQEEMRRSRAAGLNIIPTSTGAAHFRLLVIPELRVQFDGYSLRVPTPTVSIVDFVALVGVTTRATPTLPLPKLPKAL